MAGVQGRQRVMIEGVAPEIDAGRFPIKRSVGEEVVVEADVFADGHDSLTALLRYRHEGSDQWMEQPMEFLGNDRWRATFSILELGSYRYTVTGWIDHFATWRRDLIKRRDAGQNLQIELLIGATFIEEASQRARNEDARTLAKAAQDLRSEKIPLPDRTEIALSDTLNVLVAKYPDRRFASTYDRELAVVADRVKARFSAWYEMFPRSSSGKPGSHGTFKDLEARLPYVASMGFDVLYLPPIHPIGKSYRKGKNNDPAGKTDEPGSPWAIGSHEGGHKAIHPDLGTLKDFHRLISQARHHGIEIAMDIAFQCSPDHPYVKEHREWFRIRPDGTVQYAENPPKKYQDIFPLEFETERWRELWDELKSVFDYWIAQGVKIFRVDNPHTKSLEFWEWVIGEIRRQHPDVIFLSEAFTRPKLMYRLAKLGFTQSYNYFPWRNTKLELTQYFTELTQTDVREFFRPNLWPNTPDILTEHLQHGGRPAFMARLVLAGTLGASYGIYGPAFELGEHRPIKQGSEEYLDSEKYEIRHWDLDRPDSLREFIGCVNRIRRDNSALQSDGRLRFHSVDNDQLLCYSKSTPDWSNVIVVVVNLSPHHTHSGWLQLDLRDLGLEADRPFQVQDLLTNAYYLWQGPRNYIEVNPHSAPAHIFRIRRRLRTEQDFDYYL
ncbi:alpha-1,4-glucan--maltose-1-phosphate maltosyltransferase [Petrachloros mirabilis]